MLTPRLVLVGLLAAVAACLALVTGWPDPRAAAALLVGTTLSSASELAFVVLLCWVAVTGLLLASVAGLLRGRLRLAGDPRGWRMLALLAAGLGLLGLGIVRHQGGFHVCCATPSTSREVLNRVR